MSDDWFDAVAAGDFLPGPAAVREHGTPVEAFAAGYVHGMDRMREYHQKAWWHGYAAALRDTAEPLEPVEPSEVTGRVSCLATPARPRPLYGRRPR